MKLGNDTRLTSMQLELLATKLYLARPLTNCNRGKDFALELRRGTTGGPMGETAKEICHKSSGCPISAGGKE